MDSIFRYNGFENLGSFQRKVVELEAEKFKPKIENLVGRVRRIETRVKKYHDEGMSARHSINVSIVLHTRKFEADSIGWQLRPAVRDAFRKILTEIKHTFKLK